MIHAERNAPSKSDLEFGFIAENYFLQRFFSI